MNQKAKTYGLVAGILLILFTLLGFASTAISIQNSSVSGSVSSFRQLLPVLAMNLVPVLLGVALVIDNLFMAEIVTGVDILIRAAGFVSMAISQANSGSAGQSPQYTVAAVLTILASGLLLAALLLQGRRGLLLAFLSVGVNAVRIVVQNIEIFRIALGPALLSTGISLCFLAPYVLAALYIGEKGKAPAPAGSAWGRADYRTPLQKLDELQKMQQNGSVTTEEYIARKNEILDQDMPVAEKLEWYENLLRKGYLTQQEFDTRCDELPRNHMG